MTIFKAARADFLPASLIPFLIGTFYAFNRGFSLSLPKLIFGLSGVIFAHLSANLLNDYYDYKSGADNQTPKVSSFFGGSRAIQDGLFSDKEILRLSLLFLFLAFSCLLAVLILTFDFTLLIFTVAALFLAVQYTAPPLKLAYRLMGEFTIFLLFGLGLVMGSFYLFSGVFDKGSFLIALPVSFLIAAVIISNQVPDFNSDIKVGKKNLLSFVGVDNTYILYGFLILFSFGFLLLNIVMGNLSIYAALAGLIYFLAIPAFLNLKNNLRDINKLIQTSRLTLIQHFLVGAVIIIILAKR
jgi:1,4-dihydroxy-2-naphthoate polyprenyltransferase